MSARAPISLQLDGPLAVATLSRAPVNAINDEWLACLDEALARVERAEGVAALLIRSSERIFSAGADLELMRSRFDTPHGRERMVAFVREIQRVYARLARLPQVTVAEIGGAALGGGFELALACDLRIAAEQAKLGLPEARLGLLPGAGGTQRLTRIAGEATAKRLILGGEVVTGTAAEALGLVQWAVPAPDLQPRAMALAAGIAALPAAAVRACKRCIDAAREPGTDGYELEIVHTAELFANEKTQALVRKFLAKERLPIR